MSYQPVADPASIEEAAALLRAGRICAFPTETVYGLGGDATDPDAVLEIFAAKGRPRFNPLIAHCADLDMARRFGRIEGLALELAERFWPGPLTLVVPLVEASGLSDIATAGLKTVALRVPARPLARDLIASVGRPLAAPSANPSGRLSPTSAEHVRAAFEGRVPVLDGGPCEAGVESTIVTVGPDGITQLRAGALPREEIEAAMGVAVAVASHDAAISAPGMLKSHYAPGAKLRLAAAAPEPGEAYLGFGRLPEGIEGEALDLSPHGDLREAARNLFGFLARLDETGCARIAVAPIPREGLGEAINDRLERAAAPRD
ncbi:L-threonylcarbamoyladenylate synthase [Pelagibacterium montanilacus]|uniref:L-threonylcarbamoyladenylate synthase n=1 Tax=Pelagibacterium montanilacus TaxID=2185280 RepID=UPI000F8E26D8|nr:L-threonylcarbamoyladenylate synthase [Pelagibacterium montanilacus]